MTTTEFPFGKERVPLTFNFNNFVTINNFFNSQSPDLKTEAKRTFRAESEDTQPAKPFAKTRSQFFFEEKAKALPFLKPVKSYNEISEKSQTEIVEKVINKEQQVQIVEKRKVYGDDHKAEILGYLLLIGIFLFFTWFGSVVLLRLFGLRTNNVVFDLANDDLYYCMLLPLVIPITTIAVYGNWLAMKFFRHT